MDLRLMGFPELYECNCDLYGNKYSLQPIVKGRHEDVNNCGCKCHHNMIVKYIQELY